MDNLKKEKQTEKQTEKPKKQKKIAKNPHVTTRIVNGMLETRTVFDDEILSLRITIVDKK